MYRLAAAALLVTVQTCASAWAQGVVPVAAPNPGCPGCLKIADFIDKQDKFPPKHVRPYPESVLASTAPSANNQAECSSRYGYMGYVLLRGASRDPVISVSQALSPDGKARLRRVLVLPSKGEEVLILESNEPSIWELNAKDGARITHVILRGSKHQAVAGAGSTLSLTYSAVEPDKMGRGICGIPPTGNEVQDFRGFVMGPVLPGEAVEYPYTGPAVGQAADNSRELLLQALESAPRPFAQQFRKRFGHSLSAAGWRLATSRDLAEWNYSFYAGVTKRGRGGEPFRPHPEWSVVLAATRQDAQYLPLPAGMQSRVIYLGSASKLRGNREAAALLDIDTISCFHSNVSDPCSLGQALADNVLTDAVRERFQKLYGYRLP